MVDHFPGPMFIWVVGLLSGAGRIGGGALRRAARERGGPLPSILAADGAHSDGTPRVHRVGYPASSTDPPWRQARAGRAGSAHHAATPTPDGRRT